MIDPNNFHLIETSTPVGTLIAFAGKISTPGEPVAPYTTPIEQCGWMLCDGSEKDSSLYPELYAAIGNSYGGSPDGSKFNVPDLRGQFLPGINTKNPGTPFSSMVSYLIKYTYRLPSMRTNFGS